MFSFESERKIQAAVGVVFSYRSAFKEDHPFLLPPSTYTATPVTLKVQDRTEGSRITVFNQELNSCLRLLDSTLLGTVNYRPLAVRDNNILFCLNGNLEKNTTLALHLIDTGNTRRLVVQPFSYGKYLYRRFLISQLDVVEDVGNLIIEILTSIYWK